MNATKAKKIIRELVGKDYTLQAKTVSFADLARGSKVFVSIRSRYHDTNLDLPKVEAIEKTAKDNGFSVQFK